MTMTDGRIDHYLQRPTAKEHEDVEDRIKRDGSAVAALAVARSERFALPRRSRAKLAMFLDGVVAALSRLADAEIKAERDRRYKLAAVGERQRLAIHKLLGMLAANPETEKPLAALCRAIAPAFDEAGIEWDDLLDAVGEYLGGGTAAMLVAAAQRVAEGEAGRAAGKWDWETMNRKAADAATLADARERLEYKV